MAVLLFPQDVAGAPDLKVAKRQAVSRAEMRKLLNRPEALPGVLFQIDGRGIEEVGVGPVPVAPDPPPELIEIGQTEPVGVLHDDGIGVGDIEP